MLKNTNIIMLGILSNPSLFYEIEDYIPKNTKTVYSNFASNIDYTTTQEQRDQAINIIASNYIKNPTKFISKSIAPEIREALRAIAENERN